MTRKEHPLTDRETNLSRSVREVQTALDYLSRTDQAIPQVNPDGIYGAATKHAVRAFQKKVGFPETGEVDLATWSALLAAYKHALRLAAPPRTISPFVTLSGITPDSEADVLYLLQVLLRATSNQYPTSEDVPLSGKLDLPTMEALRALQRAQGLPQTGLPDRATWDALATAYDLYRDSEH
jgi:peptidoglycan hydrolase-like protein with peptidoglycan-binding domain